MNVLTLWEPWAWAMAHAGKWIENRTWAPPATALGQPLVIHAAKRKPDQDMLAEIVDEYRRIPTNHGLPTAAFEIEGATSVGRLAPGCIQCIGILAGYLAPAGKPSHITMRGIQAQNGKVYHGDEVRDFALRSGWWDPDCYGWIVCNRVALPDPIQVRGQQGLWRLPEDAEDTVRTLMFERSNQ